VSEVAYLKACVKLDAVGGPDLYTRVVAPLLPRLSTAHRDVGGTEGPPIVRKFMYIIIEMSSTLQAILLAQWVVLTRIFKLGYHEPKTARSSVFLRKLSEFRTESELPDLLYTLFVEDRDPAHRHIMQYDMRVLSRHMLHELILYLYELTRVDVDSDTTPISYPHPSAQCMIGGWAIFSTHNYYLVLYAKNPRQPKWKQMADLVARLSVSASEVGAVTGNLTSAFFTKYNRGKLRLPHVDLLHLFAAIHYLFLKFTSGGVLKSSTFQSAEKAILENAELFESFTALCAAVTSANSCPTIDIARPVFVKLTLKFLHVREGQYLSRSNAQVGMTLALRTMLASSASRAIGLATAAGARQVPVRLSEETCISTEVLPLVDEIDRSDDGHSSSSESDSSSDEDGAPVADVNTVTATQTPVTTVRSLHAAFDQVL
jgi:hypothetical protein